MTQTYLNGDTRSWPREPEDVPPARFWYVIIAESLRSAAAWVKNRLAHEWSRRTAYGKARLPIDILVVTFIAVILGSMAIIWVISEVSWSRLTIYTLARVTPITAPNRIQPKVYKDDSENQRRGEDDV